MQRSRNGESLVEHEELRKQIIERREQFEVNVLPNKDKFNTTIDSNEDNIFQIISDKNNIL